MLVGGGRCTRREATQVQREHANPGLESNPQPSCCDATATHKRRCPCLFAYKVGGGGRDHCGQILNPVGIRSFITARHYVFHGVKMFPLLPNKAGEHTFVDTHRLRPFRLFFSTSATGSLKPSHLSPALPLHTSLSLLCKWPDSTLSCLVVNKLQSN